MVTNELLDFIKEQRAKGIPDDATKTALIINGWNTSDIEKEYRFLDTRLVGKFKKGLSKDPIKQVFALQILAVVLTVLFGLFSYHPNTGAGLSFFQLLNKENPIQFFGFNYIHGMLPILGLLGILYYAFVDCFFLIWIYAGLRGVLLSFHIQKQDLENKKSTKVLLFTSIICILIPILSILGHDISSAQIIKQAQQNFYGSKCQELNKKKVFTTDDGKYYDVNCVPY